jgi:hypothetical protein
MPTPSLFVHLGTFLTKVFEDFPSHELQNPKCDGAMDSAFLLLACISNLSYAQTNKNL